MEDSVKGILVTITIICLFITAIVNFIVIFPQEQGVSFVGQDQHGYLTINSTNLGTVSSLDVISNQTSNAYNQWDISVGFMGSNQIKQSQGGITSMVGNTFSNIKIIATELFTSNSPILYAILVLSSLATGYLIYAFYKFIRTGY